MSHPKKKQPPTVMVPELFRVTGGVQVFSRRMIEALDAIYSQKVSVISRNDRHDDCPADFLEGRRFIACGNLPAGLRRFALMARSLKTSGEFIVSTHPHFSPWLRLLKKPFLCVSHGIDVWSIKGSKVAKGLEAAALVLPVSRYTEDRLKSQLGETMPQSQVFPNTFDAERFQPGSITTEWRERLNISNEAKVILSICRVAKTEAGKGYHLLLETLPDLLKKHPELVWILGGKGDDLDTVKAKAESLGVIESCRFPGFIPDDELVDLYRSSDLFVLPSKKEGFGIVFLEAAASGLPVIAGNKDGSVDALADGELGTLIDPENKEELKTAISKIIKSPGIDKKALYENCRSRFGKDAFKQRLEDILLSRFV